MIDNSNNSGIILDDERRVDFLLSKTGTRRVEKHPLFSHPRKVPFLLEDIMSTKLIEHICKNCNKIFLNYLSNHKTYCSQECRNQDWSKILKNNHPRYWLGKHRSKKTKIKISKNNGGFKKGKLNHMWKGGITSEEEKIRVSIEYELWRNAVRTRDNWTCQSCKVAGGKLHIHHIKSFTSFPELRLAIDNGITLCIECHRKKHKRSRNV